MGAAILLHTISNFRPQLYWNHMKFKTFGEWLRHKRLQKEVSPFKMAEALGYKRVSAIYNFEYGIAPLPITKWPLMAEILGLPVEEFLAAMEGFAPDKVAEFRLIRSTAVSPEGPDSPKVGVWDEENLPVITPTAMMLADDRLRMYQFADAEIIFVTQETWEDSMISAVAQLGRQGGRRLGLVQVTETSAFPAVAIVSSLKEAKMICILEPVTDSEPQNRLTERLKAAFLDALTGADGYPEIHRVPKIFSIEMPRIFDQWNAQSMERVLRHFEENGRERHLTLKVLSPSLGSVKSR